MIKYLGSKRVLVPVLGAMAAATGARTAVDLFTGTTRVAQEFKRLGMAVTASDLATYAEVLARCYIATDARAVDAAALADEIDRLNALPGRPGYVTRTFCEEARYFQPANGARIDAIRDAIEADHGPGAPASGRPRAGAGADEGAPSSSSMGRGTAAAPHDPLYPILLTSLMEAADRVDSTTGQQMAYLKQWAARASNPLRLRAPELMPGAGRAIRGDAREVARTLPPVDLAYLDPPYNQHRYFGNYHVWETLIRWDAPETYGIARKRVDARDPSTGSDFNRRREMPPALGQVIRDVRAGVVMVSYNDESWIDVPTLAAFLRDAGHAEVRVLGFDSKRYVGAQIGIYSPAGRRVGQVGRLRNTEYVFVAGPREQVEAAVAAGQAAGGEVVPVVEGGSPGSVS